ncbi:MAG TPA: hypothetical protein VEC58_08925 [Roseiarcus sp.]|nr:hypothetical protein [Roseiarcus sp.]
MRSVFKKSVAASLAALVLGSSLTASTPAAAYWRYHGGYWGGAVALGVIGGLAAGAIVASQYDCVRYRPVFDRYGNFIGREPINVC